MMTKRILAISLGIYVLAFLAGCQDEYNDGYAEIVGRDDRLKIPVPAPVTTVQTHDTVVRNTYSKYPSEWKPPRNVEKKWKAIVIHHTATLTGNMSSIDSAHKHNGWEGVGYDFVIGNGKGSKDGQVEVTFRWRKQVTGAHCKSKNNWANKDSIGICLVGNFSRTRPGYKQMNSLVNLVSFLQKRYGIPSRNIFGHENTPSHTTATECPGKYFPWNTFDSMLAAVDRKGTSAGQSSNAK